MISDSLTTHTHTHISMSIDRQIDRQSDIQRYLVVRRKLSTVNFTITSYFTLSLTSAGHAYPFMGTDRSQPKFTQKFSIDIKMCYRSKIMSIHVYKENEVLTCRLMCQRCRL